MNSKNSKAFSQLPSVSELLALPQVQPLFERYSRPLVTEAIRTSVELERVRIRQHLAGERARGASLESVDPVGLGDPVDSVDPMSFGEPAGPVESVSPVERASPVDPVTPIACVDSLAPVDPASPFAPVAQVASTDPVTPSAPPNPAETRTPTDPTSSFHEPWIARIHTQIHGLTAPRLIPVINATGVVLHTNLGRAPLAQAVVDEIAAAASGYCNLELELESGKRGGRMKGVAAHICGLTGAEAALAVNNGAAAALLMLSTLPKGSEVLVSRGELVEIGGSFRIPEVLEQSGCKLVEVGSTNRTRISDYRKALGPGTGAILKVHPSNFHMLGFVESTSFEELGQLAKERGVAFFYDQGSGDLEDVSAALRAGADLVSFSGDKLLGGPQAGLLVGTDAAVESAATHPLARALRLDKLGLVALEKTLQLHRMGRREKLPIWEMWGTPLETLRERAERLQGLLSGHLRASREEAGASDDGKIQLDILPTTAPHGGGTNPGAELESVGLRISTPDPEGVARRLRRGGPPVVLRIEGGALWVDLRTVPEAQLEVLADKLGSALSKSES